MKTTLEGVARKPSETDDGDSHLKLEDIIVPMELPPASMRALRFAGRLAEQFGSRVHLLHVEEPAILLNDFESQVVIAKSADEVAGEMKEELTRIAQRELPSRVSADAIVRSGRPAQEIIRPPKSCTATSSSLQLADAQFWPVRCSAAQRTPWRITLRVRFCSFAARKRPASNPR